MSLLKIDCIDKKTHHMDQLDPLMPRFPCRVLIAGRSNSGKGSLVKNMVSLATPAYDKIYIMHYDEKTEEYDDLDPDKIFTIESIPDDWHECFNRQDKNALIIDEINFEGMSKANKGKIDRLTNYCCSHLSISLFLIQQNFTSVPPCIRRAMDWYVIYPSVDNESTRYLSRITGRDIVALKKQHCKTRYDSICFDMSGDGPELRLNLFTPIS